MACGPVEEAASTAPGRVPRGAQRSAAACVVPTSKGRSSKVTRGDAPGKTLRSKDRSSQLNPTLIQKPRLFGGSSLKRNPPPVWGRGPGRAHASPEVEIPGPEISGGDGPFLVHSSCQSICENYSDLLIRGDQVLPLSSDGAGERLMCADTNAAGPFLHSCDVLPAGEDSLPEQSSRAGHLLPRRAGSHRWRQGSGCDRSVLFHGREGPFTNSFLNCYLEQKLLDLYQQYMLENMARDQAAGDPAGGDPAPPCPLLASELILTSLDQITLRVSRDHRLEAGLAKDMVISCLLRVASDMQSGEISTPVLQFSEDPPTPRTPAEAGGEEEEPAKDAANPLNSPETSAIQRTCDRS
ncbi:hypothetical protein NHX12_022459 [Muraenolepis orangiensis]|uniref:Uncharacterized protein n=1 Tax=Muraenolepis orangiensis TaxID=630683 RepID=A0A9Q0ETK7_9TELE|nr:hypothetical protein NHX12_022459 [Muraenolepis orangiensis]